MKADFTNGIRDTNRQTIVRTMLGESIDKCNAIHQRLYGKLGAYTFTTTSKKFPEFFEFQDEINKTGLTDKIVNCFLKDGGCVSSQSGRVNDWRYFDDMQGHGYYFSDQPSTLLPRSVDTTKTKVFFKDNSAEFQDLVSPNALVSEIRGYNVFQPKNGTTGTFNPAYQVDRIQITASSSTGSNQANFCQKDFINLNRARADAIQKLMMDNFNIPAEKFVVPSIGGKLGDGSSGRCAYTCKNKNVIPRGTICEEEFVNPRVPNDELEESQNVSVAIYPVTGTAGQTTAAAIDLHVVTNKYKIAYGCESDPVKFCIDPNPENGDPGNLLR